MLFLSGIALINLVGISINSDKNQIQTKYFENLDLKISGVICSIEEQNDTYKLIVTLGDIKSYYQEYKKNSPLLAYFCIHNDENVVFVDHGDYSIGDTIYLGENSSDLIRCVSEEGKLKFTKKRSDAILYTIATPNERMEELLKLGC